MTYSVPPLRLAEFSPLTRPLTRPFNMDIDCVLALLPDINTKWIDYSNNSNHATKRGNPTIVPGRIHQALRFDGVGDFLTVSDHASITFGTADFSIVVWMRSTDDTIADLVEKGTGAAFYVVKMLANGKAHCQIYDGVTSKTRVSIVTMNDGAWHLIVATFDRDGLMKLYTDDDSYVANIDISGVGDISNAVNLLIGDDALSGSYYVGDLDEILIFNRVLEAWEVRALYNMGAP